MPQRMECKSHLHTKRIYSQLTPTQFAQHGQYARAMALLGSVDPETLRTLRSYQSITSYSGLIKLRMALRRCVSQPANPTPSHNPLTLHSMDTLTSSHLLHALKSSALPDPELTFQLTLLEIDHHTRLGSFQTAFNKLEDLALRLKEDDADVYQRMHLLTQKALLFARCGEPEKGFSVVLRAASLAHGARVMPALWEGMAALCGILVGLEEWGAARRVLDAVIPQVSAKCFGSAVMLFQRLGRTEDRPDRLRSGCTSKTGLEWSVWVLQLMLVRLSKGETWCFARRCTRVRRMLGWAWRVAKRKRRSNKQTKSAERKSMLIGPQRVSLPLPLLVRCYSSG